MKPKVRQIWRFLICVWWLDFISQKKNFGWVFLYKLPRLGYSGSHLPNILGQAITSTQPNIVPFTDLRQYDCFDLKTAKIRVNDLFFIIKFAFLHAKLCTWDNPTIGKPISKCPFSVQLSKCNSHNSRAYNIVQIDEIFL